MNAQTIEMIVAQYEDKPTVEKIVRRTPKKEETRDNGKQKVDRKTIRYSN